MVSNMEVVNKVIIGRVEPHIYAFTTESIRRYLKVGDTYRPVSKRLEEWGKHYSNLKQEFEDTAKVSNDTYFRDYSVHQYLENKLNKKRLTEKDIPKGIYFSKEFFKDTTAKDVKEAIDDIKKDYENKGNRYSFYNVFTSLPQTTKFPPTGTWEPRANQKQAIDSFKQAVNNDKKENLLMYAVMRFGKSFTAMCCAKEIDAKFVVIVSGKKDVRIEWKKTVESAENFKDYEFLTTDDLKRNDSIVTDYLSNNQNIVLFLTLQELMGEEIKDRHKQVFARQIDLLIVDETHFGARAEKYGEILRKKYEDDFVNLEDAEVQIKALNAKITLHLSGTPYRILMGSEFKKEDIIAFVQYTDIVNEQKKWDKEHLFKYDKKNKKEWEEWENPYYGFPQMVRFAFNPNKSSIEKLEELKKSGISYAFSELFRTKSLEEQNDDSHKSFIHKKEILELFEVIDGSKKDKNLLSFLDYDKIKKGNMCRHIVCVLPYCASCDALEKLIKDNKTKFKNLCEYEIINISGINNKYKNIESIKDTISNCEKQDKKTITLTVNRMLTGSTVEQWDTMIYLKDTSSPQEYDQAIFRLQNPYIKTYITKNDKEKHKEIKYNMKPQTLLVDFSPDRMFRMQELKSQIYNVNIDEAGNTKLKERIREELSISPIITINKDKIQEVNETDIMNAVNNYSKSRGIAEETNDIPVDLNLMEISEIRDRIIKENELGSKLGFEIKANEGEGEDIEIPDSANEPNKDQQKTESENLDEKDNQLNPEKQFRMYYARILYFAFLTKDKVESIENIINIISDVNNNRIFNNLQLNKDVIIAIKNHMDKFKLSKLDYAIQNINHLSHEVSLQPIERAKVANKKFGKLGESEVVTPENITTDMINLLPDEFFKECVENKKCILDIASKEGEFAIAIYNKFDSLGYSKDEIKNLIYSIPTSSITYEFTRKIYEILGLNINNIAYKFNSYDLLKIKDDKNSIDYNKIKLILNQKKKFSEITINDNPKVGGDDNMKFDAVVGNPPYQEIISKTIGNKSLGKQLFPWFMILATKISSRYVSFITPSKWFSSEGQDHSFVFLREYMKNNNHFKKIFHYSYNAGLFDDVQIGAINYFLYDLKYNNMVEFNNCDLNNQRDISYRPLFENNLDIIIPLNSMVSIINKIKNMKGFISMMTITKGRNAFNVVGNKKVIKQISSDKHFKNAVKVFCAHQEIRYIERKYITKNIDLIDNWKVFISKANGSAGTLSSDKQVYVLGKPFIGEPNSVCTDSLIPIGNFNNRVEALNLQQYIKTKFFRFIVGVLKVSQNLYQNVYSLVPVQNFTNKSDINWNCSIEEIDKQLYKKYKLTKEEIKYIESMIKPME